MDIAAQPIPIPVPDGFPVAWPAPEDAHRLWTRETMHAPGQMTALDIAVCSRWIHNGMNPAFETFSFPVRNRYLALNTYLYQSIFPFTFDHDELHRLGAEAERRIGAAMGVMRDRWEGEQLPAVQRIFAGWEAVDHTSLDGAAFTAHLTRVLLESERVWEIHFNVVFPMLVAMSLFDDFYVDTLGATDRYETMRLLGGFENLSVKADRELYLLSRAALTAPEVRAVLETTASADIRAALAGSAAGRDFLGQLDGFLAVYGRRTPYFLHISVPSLLEDDSTVIAALKDLITHPDHDPYHELARLAAEREQLVAAARERLTGYPEPVRGQFEFLLEAAQFGAVLQEDHNFHLDGQVTYLVRGVVLDAGRRLAAAGCIGAANDVFHLTDEELLAGLAGLGLRDTVAARKAELERWAGSPTPPVLGAFPPGPPPNDPVARAIDKMFGAPPRPAETPGTLHGNGGSPGIARGRARVIRSLADSDRLQHGDILVTETTAPPWTPLFARAAAVVTDAGGILSHCAIVAREYAIPAVVGVGMGTAVIQDGQLVEVDGDAGVVRIIAE